MNEVFKLLAGSAAGASFIAVTQILTLDCPDRCLIWSVCVFAVAIPMLVNFYLKPPGFKKEKPRRGDPEYNLAVGYLLLLFLDAAGFALVFFHFGSLPGLFFIASFVAANFWFLKREPGRFHPN